MNISSINRTLDGRAALRLSRTSCRLAQLAGVVASICIAAPTSSQAIEMAPNEKEHLKSCERRLCTMILKKEERGKDLECDLTKTWLKAAIDKGSRRKVTWGFGDAQCSTKVELKRRDVIAALTQRKHTIMLHGQKAVCKVERYGEIRTVRAVLSPKLKFKHGKARKLWINLKELDGPADIKGTVWTAASLADSLGIFHKRMIKGINKFAFQKCRKNFGKELGLDVPEQAKNTN